MGFSFKTGFYIGRRTSLFSLYPTQASLTPLQGGLQGWGSAAMAAFSLPQASSNGTFRFCVTPPKCGFNDKHASWDLVTIRVDSRKKSQIVCQWELPLGLQWEEWKLWMGALVRYWDYQRIYRYRIFCRIQD